MEIFKLMLLGFLIVCAVAVVWTKSLLASVIIFMSYSLMMSVIWILLQSPDLAITEAAVGAGVTSLLFFVTLKKIRAVSKNEDEAEKGKTPKDAQARGGQKAGNERSENKVGS